MLLSELFWLLPFIVILTRLWLISERSWPDSWLKLFDNNLSQLDWLKMCDTIWVNGTLTQQQTESTWLWLTLGPLAPARVLLNIYRAILKFEHRGSSCHLEMVLSGLERTFSGLERALWDLKRVFSGLERALSDLYMAFSDLQGPLGSTEGTT